MNIYLEQEKHKFRIAARFLRQRGVNFDNGNFYDLIRSELKKLNPLDQIKLHEVIEWIFEYEQAEKIHWETAPAPAGAEKQKASFARKCRSRDSHRESIRWK